MPLPDAIKRSPRVYTLLQNLDLENLSADNLADVGDPIAIEEANEDELRRLCLVAFARMVTKGSFDGWLSGGVKAIPLAPSVIPTTSGSDLRQYPLIAQTGSLETTSNGVFSNNITTAMFFPFYAPETSDIASLTCKTAQDSDDNVLVCLYDSDDNGLPQDQLGTVATWDMGGAGVNTVDVSGLADTWNVTRGNRYWLGMMMETVDHRRPTFYVHDSDEVTPYMLPTNDSATATYKPGLTHFKTAGLSGALPASATPADLFGVSGPFALTPYIGVVM